MLPSLPFNLSPDTAPNWLVHRGLLAPDEPIAIVELGGGVSSTVLKVATHDDCLVLKQPLFQLKVEGSWEIGLDRIFIERDFIASMAEIGLGDYAPRLVACDEGSYILAMGCAEDGMRMWKTVLFELAAQSPGPAFSSIGEHSLALLAEPGAPPPPPAAGLPALAAKVGRVLAEMQNRTFDNSACAARFSQNWNMLQGRVEPYYRVAAARHPDLAPLLERATHPLLEDKRVLVHGDFSPKNILVDPASLMILDHEIAHFGHAAFDPAFCLAHLVLKTIVVPPGQDRFMAGQLLDFWRAYRAAVNPAIDPGLDANIALQLGWLLLARVDGRSRVEYLRDESLRDLVRALARDVILRPPASLEAVFRLLFHHLAKRSGYREAV